MAPMTTIGFEIRYVSQIFVGSPLTLTSVDTFKRFLVALLITGVGRPPLVGGNGGNDRDPSYFCGRRVRAAAACPPDRRQPGSAPFSELNIQFAFSSTIWVAATSFGVGCWSE